MDNNNQNDYYNNNQNDYYYNNQNGYQNYNNNQKPPDRYGVTSMVLGIVGLAVCGICSIIALVYSSKQNAISPNGFSTAGKITGIIGIVVWAITIVTYVVVFVVVLQTGWPYDLF